MGVSVSVSVEAGINGSDRQIRYSSNGPKEDDVARRSVDYKHGLQRGNVSFAI